MFKKNYNKKLAIVLTSLLLAIFSSPIVQSIGKEYKSIVPLQEGVDEYTNENFLIDYEFVTENKGFALYADMKRGFFSVRNKSSGSVWYSTPIDSVLDTTTSARGKMEVCSQLILEYIYTEDEIKTIAPNRVNSQSACVNSGNITVEKILNGIKVVYKFADISTEVPVEYKLISSGLEAKVLINDIDQTGTSVLTSIELLPSFGAGNWEDKGYLFVPDGCGALIEFNNNQVTDKYESMVYGNDRAIQDKLKRYNTETIRMPVFGIVNDTEALVGIITDGDSSAAIAAKNGTKEHGYNMVYSKVSLRNLTKKILFEKNDSNKIELSRLSPPTDDLDHFTVQYSFLSGTQANYIGMANVYRNYLIEQHGLKKSVKAPALGLGLLGAINVDASIMGIPYEKQIALTTLSQADEIVNRLRSLGVERMSLQYLGWGNDGYMNVTIPQKANLVQKLGSNKDLEKLRDLLKEYGYSFYPDVDFVRYLKEDSRAITNAFNERTYQYEYLRSVYSHNYKSDPLFLLNPRFIPEISKNYLNSYQELGISGISLETLSSYTYSSYHSKTSFNRVGFSDMADEVFSWYKDKGLSIAASNANAYTFPYVERIYSSPTLTSAYDVFDKEVPFYQIVLHGYISITTEPMMQSVYPEINFLKAVESGSELYYSAIWKEDSYLKDTRYEHLYSSNYEIWMNQASEQYKNYYPLLEKIYDKSVVIHEELAQDVMSTTFEGGIQVIVNYNSSNVIIDGNTIPALDFISIEREESD